MQAPLSPAANLGIYRNNSDWQFRSALAASFPVLKKRVGDEYFRQLAFHYRAGHPSRSGDLHWVGRDFAGFLAVHLRDGDYAWLADLARLEWAREVASVSETRPAIGADCLSRFAPEDLGRLVFELQPDSRTAAAVVKVDYVLERAIGTVVHVRCGELRVAQSRRAERVVMQRVRANGDCSAICTELRATFDGAV